MSGASEMLSPYIAVGIKGVEKRYGSFTALEQINLDIQDNEFFTLLGPSGCGKTSLLRIIAGFEATSAGSVRLYSEEIETLPPNKRPINTVFQNYALFPHMSVADNIGFGLRMLGWSKDKVHERVNAMIAMVRLDGFELRKPSQLSGGQQQRVALARAIAPKPRLLLLDEPLSALDLKLRQQMRAELKQIQRDTGITFVFVTHDQEEALSMSDRIAVMSAGKVQQVGTPTEIYEMPTNCFVADFIGESNLIKARVVASNGIHIRVRLPTDDVIDAVNANPDETIAGPESSPVVLLRPESMSIEPLSPDNRKVDSSLNLGANQLQGIVVDMVYLGTDRQYTVALNDTLQIHVRQQNPGSGETAIETGASVSVRLAGRAARLLSE